MKMNISNNLLVFWFGIFFFTAWVIEPMFYFACGAPPSLSLINVQVTDDWDLSRCSDWSDPFTSLWKMYGNWDPLFVIVPDFMRVMCAIEVFLFGPSYALIFLGLIKFRNNNPSPLIHMFDTFCYIFAGAVTYSTIVYFMYEAFFTAIQHPEGTNMAMVIIVNCPWTIIPILLIIQRFQRDEERRKKKEN